MDASVQNCRRKRLEQELSQHQWAMHDSVKMKTYLFKAVLEKQVAR